MALLELLALKLLSFALRRDAAVAAAGERDAVDVDVRDGEKRENIVSQ